KIPTPIVERYDAGVEVYPPKFSPRNIYWRRAIYRPGKGLEYHTHPVDEILVVLKGSLPARVEGRLYKLGHLDAIYIPRTPADNTIRTAHWSWNQSSQNVMFLVAITGNKLVRDFLDNNIIPPEPEGPGNGADNTNLPEGVEQFSPVSN